MKYVEFFRFGNIYMLISIYTQLNEKLINMCPSRLLNNIPIKSDIGN